MKNSKLYSEILKKTTASSPAAALNALKSNNDKSCS